MAHQSGQLSQLAHPYCGLTFESQFAGCLGDFRNWDCRRRESFGLVRTKLRDQSTAGAVALKALSEICVRSSDQSRAFSLSDICIQISDVIAFKRLILDRLGQSPSGQVRTPVDFLDLALS
jgi:hypothetical protein